MIARQQKKQPRLMLGAHDFFFLFFLEQRHGRVKTIKMMKQTRKQRGDGCEREGGSVRQEGCL